MLTTTEAAALLTERGLRDSDGGPVRPRTVKQWCLRGKFPGAINDSGEGNKRGTWRIPRTALDAFTPPAPGRRRKTKG